MFLAGPTLGKPPTKGVDLDTPGTVNGESIYELDLGSLDDYPWRKPGIYMCIDLQPWY